MCWRFPSAPFGLWPLPATPPPHGRSTPTKSPSVFALRCYVESETPAGEVAYRLRPVEVRVLVTGDYLLTLHEERISLPTVLARELPEERSKRYVVYAVLDAMLETTSDALAEVERRLDAIGRAWAEESGGRAVEGDAARDRREARDHAALGRRRAGRLRANRRGDRRASRLRHARRAVLRPSDEQVDRLLASIDAAVNAMAMLLDLQLNERAYVVSVVATIFVPLTFVTGLLRHELRVDGRSHRHSDRLLAARVHRPHRGSAALLASLGAPVSHR